MSYTKWQNDEPKPNDDSNDNSESQTNDAESTAESNAETSGAESNAETSGAESNAESSNEDNSNDDSETKAALCIVTDSEFKWITVECAKETKYYMCSRPLIPNCGRNGRCKMSNAFTLPVIN